MSLARMTLVDRRSGCDLRVAASNAAELRDELAPVRLFLDRQVIDNRVHASLPDRRRYEFARIGNRINIVTPASAIPIMTFAAVLPVAEADARALLDALERDEALAARPIDLSETAPGRWEAGRLFRGGTGGGRAGRARRRRCDRPRPTGAGLHDRRASRDRLGQAQPRRVEADPRRPLPRPWPA